MPHSTLAAYPPALRGQLTGLLEIVGALLGQNLVGAYTTSPAPAADTPALRLLVVTTRDVLRDTKLGPVQALLRRSGQPAALAVLAVRQAGLVGAQPSLPIQLHFAEGLRPQLAAATTSLLWLNWSDGPNGAVDRATALGTLQQAALTLAGPALPTLLAPAGATAPPVFGPDAPRVRPRQERQLTLDQDAALGQQQRESG